MLHLAFTRRIHQVETSVFTISLVICFMASGILAPVTVGSLLMVVFGDISERVSWCEVLMLSRSIIVYLFFCTMIFGLLFRYVLIRYSSRGLVIEGKPDLRLFHQLYWLIFWATFCCLIFGYPISRMINGKFIDSSYAKICLLHPLEVDQTFRLGRMTLLFSPLLAEIYNQMPECVQRTRWQASGSTGEIG